MKPWLRMAMALCIAFTPAAAAAQQAQKESQPANKQPQKGPGGVQDGIKLHGNWVIEVRNPGWHVGAPQRIQERADRNGSGRASGLA